MHCVVVNRKNIATSARPATKRNGNTSTSDRLMLTSACHSVAATDLAQHLTRPPGPRRGDRLMLALGRSSVFIEPQRHRIHRDTESRGNHHPESARIRVIRGLSIFEGDRLTNGTKKRAEK